MTHSILLGSEEEHKIVCAAAGACDFKRTYFFSGSAIYVHRNIADLRLQIHRHAGHFFDMEGILTQVEFDDLTNRFPDDHPRAVEALRQLHEKLPNFWYRENFVFATEDLAPPLPLFEYLIELEKK
ncbi:hypothetical protein KY338_06150 [Candidatus Woesearchaeota archaeon]|nr:hypothetical protein [Candidatus Woesearchaeota archaeon]MBW3005851.1 hypothetical protein [Candidatus Woesearchaeota archaeon]